MRLSPTVRSISGIASMHSPWLSWVYYYGVGGILLVTSVVLILRTGAARWSLWTDRRLLALLLIGTVASAACHAAWIVWATGE